MGGLAIHICLGCFCLLLFGGGLFLANGAPAFAQKSPAEFFGSRPQDKPEQAIPSAPRGKKLVLKDGTFHLVRSYEQKGDRVRYYSVERSAWEEIPAELVDWEATRKAEEEEARKGQELLEKAHAAEVAAQAAEIDVDASIEVAPGVFLPPGEGLFAVEGTTVIPLVSVGADVKLDKGRLLTQILVPVPLIPSRHRIQLAGKRASIRLTTAEPEFYFRTADAREPEVELLRAQVKGNAREVETVDTNVAGVQARRGKTVPIQRWKAARGVYRFTMGEKLAPGEYALAEFLASTQGDTRGADMSFYLWDFGVDPSSSPAPSPKEKQN
jgi:hypothetical protein